MQHSDPNSDQPSQPIWFQGNSLSGSAVRYIAGLSSEFQWVGIYFLKGKQLELGPYIGEPTDHQIIPVGKGVCGTAVAENRDQNVPDVRKIENYLSCSLKVRSELVILIHDAEGKTVGVVDIDSHTENAFGPAEEQAVRQVVRELEGALNRPKN